MSFATNPLLSFRRLSIPRLLLSSGLALLAVTPALATESPREASLSDDTPLPEVQRPLAYLPPIPLLPQPFQVTPERRALLNTIRYAEGTWKDGDAIGYRVLFGGGLFESFERHPDRVIRSSRYTSAAAGAYQFMPFTWALVTRALGLRTFHPEAQDQGALFLIQRRGALALADLGVLTPQLAAKLAPEWASFPTLAGRSYYGQPVKRFDELRRFYEWNLARLRQGLEGPLDAGTLNTLASRQRPAPCDSGSLTCRLDSLGPRPLAAVIDSTVLSN